MKESKLYKIIGFISFLYLLFALNPFILWLAWPPLFNIPIYILVFFSFIILLGRNDLVGDSYRGKIFVCIILLAIHINLPVFTNVFDGGRFISFVIFSLIVFFPLKVWIYTYKYFRKFNLIITFSAIIIFCFTLFIDLPHIVIYNNTFVLEGTDYFYKLYGFIVSSTNTVYKIGGLSIARLCGVYPEPGHFAVYLSILTIFEKIFFNRFSKIFLIGGILTFSPVYYIVLVLVFVVDFVVNKKTKYLKYCLISFFLLSIGISLLNDNLKNLLWEMAIGRNLGDNVGSRLDERSNLVIVKLYEKFVETSEIWFGRGVQYVENFGLMSDFRGFIFKYGLIGLILSVILLLLIIFGKVKSLMYRFYFIIFSFLIFLHRSWMFGSTYMYMILIMMAILFYNKKYIVDEFEKK